MSNKPKCIIVTGRPGSGKTTLARLLGERLRVPVISRDEIKEGYVNTFGVKHDQLPADANGVVSNLFFEIVDLYLTRMVSVVIEAAFQHKVWAPRIARIIETSSPFMVICTLDGEAAARRHLHRGLNDPHREFYHGDKRVSNYRETGILGPPADYVAPEFEVPTVHVSTEESCSPTVDEIVNQIRAQVPRNRMNSGNNACMSRLLSPEHEAELLEAIGGMSFSSVFAACLDTASYSVPLVSATSRASATVRKERAPGSI
jgi:predicted kinase